MARSYALEALSPEREAIFLAERERFFAMMKERLGATSILILVSAEAEEAKGTQCFYGWCGDAYAAYGMAKRFVKGRERQWKRDGKQQEAQDDG